MTSIDVHDVFVWLLATFRATGLLLVLPLFIVQSVPRIMRVGFAAALAWVTAPYLTAAVVIPAQVPELVLLIAKELSVGLLMGFAVRLVLILVDFAAQVLAVEIGINPAPEFDLSNSAAGNPVGTSLFYLGVVVFFSGAHYAVFYAFARSFELVPPGLQEVNLGFVDVVVKQTARIFQLGLLMAAPVVAVNFLINLVFSILGRVVSKMNVFILSFTVRLGAGLTMLALSAGLIVHYIMQQFSESPELMLHFMPFGGS